MSLSFLPNDCIQEISKHLNYKSHSNLETTSKLEQTIVTKKDLHCNHSEKKTKKNDLYEEYTGEYKIVKKDDTTKKVRHGYGMLIKKTGKYTYRVYQGLFKNNIPIDYIFTYHRKPFTYKGGPFIGQYMDEIQKNYVCQKKKPTKVLRYDITGKYIDGSPWTTSRRESIYKDNLIRYFGESKDNMRHGYGILIEMSETGNEMTTYCYFKNGIKHGRSVSYISDNKNPFICKKIYCEYDMGKKVGKEFIISKTYSVHNWNTHHSTLDCQLTIKEHIDDTEERIAMLTTTKALDCRNYLFNNIYMGVKHDINLTEYPYIDTLKPCPCKFCSCIKIFSETSK